MKAGGSYAIVFGKKLQSLACKALNVELKSAFAPSKQVYNPDHGFTAVEKIFNKEAPTINDSAIINEPGKA